MPKKYLTIQKTNTTFIKKYKNKYFLPYTVNYNAFNSAI